MNQDEKRIRELAHQIWESEGKPEGQHDRHWEMACKLAKASSQELPKTTSRAKRVTKPKAAPPAKPLAKAIAKATEDSPAAPIRKRSPRATAARKPPKPTDS